MTDSEFWARRQARREKELYKKTSDELDKKVKKYYESALKEIESEINALYARYADENGLSMSEARKLIRGAEYKKWRKNLREYLEKSTGNKKFQKELNTLSMRSRISRLEVLEARTLMAVADLEEKLGEFITAQINRAFVESKYGTLYDIGQRAGLTTPPVAVDPSHIKEVLLTPWSGKIYLDRNYSHCKGLAKKLQAAVIQGIHRGTSIQKLSKELSRQAEITYRESYRLVRTEMNYFQTRGAAEAIKDAEFEYYQFVATLDNRTTPRCQSLDGRVFKVEEMMQGENAPPMHPRCRSTIIASDGEKLGGKRISAGRVKIPADVTYSDWKNGILS